MRKNQTCKCGSHDGSERWHGTPGGYTNHNCRCTDCSAAQSTYSHENHLKNPGRRSEWNRKWYQSLSDEQKTARQVRAAQDPEKKHAYHVKTKYGLTPAQEEAVRRFYGNRCGICQIRQEDYHLRLCIDHDARTGLVRGLLCTPCNSGIGQLRHNTAILNAAILYLNCQLIIGKDRGDGTIPSVWYFQKRRDKGLMTRLLASSTEP